MSDCDDSPPTAATSPVRARRVAKKAKRAPARVPLDDGGIDDDEMVAAIDAMLPDTISASPRGDASAVRAAPLKRKASTPPSLGSVLEDGELESPPTPCSPGAVSIASTRDASPIAAADAPPPAPVVAGPQLYVPRNPSKVQRVRWDASVDFLNPNSTLSWFSKVNGLNVHCSEQDPAYHFKVRFSGNFANFVSSTQQRFDFAGGTNFTRDLFAHCRGVITIGAFGVVKDPQVFPHGNRVKLPNSKFPAPDLVKARHRLPITNDEYCAKLRADVDGVIVDVDMHAHMAHWFGQRFDEFIRGDEVWDATNRLFPLRYKTIKDLQESKAKSAHAKFLTQHKTWAALSASAKRSAGAEPQDASAAMASDAVCREEFMAGIRSVVNTSARDVSVNFTRAILVNETKKDRDLRSAGNAPSAYTPPDAFFSEMYNSPPPFIDADKQSKPGWPRRANPVIMYRCVTLAERLAMPPNSSASPLVRLAWDVSHVCNDDVVAPIFSFEQYDTPLAFGWRMLLVGIIWLGVKGSLDEDREPPSYDRVDPTSYFLLAQEYTRGKNFRHQEAPRADHAMFVKSAAAANDEQQRMYSDFTA